MPTIHRQDGFEVVIYTHDHPPAHVHVFDADGEVVVLLGQAHEKPQVRENNGMRPKREKQAVALVAENQEAFWQRWRRFHGNA